MNLGLGGEQLVVRDGFNPLRDLSERLGNRGLAAAKDGYRESNFCIVVRCFTLRYHSISNMYVTA